MDRSYIACTTFLPFFPPPPLKRRLSLNTARAINTLHAFENPPSLVCAHYMDGPWWGGPLYLPWHLSETDWVVSFCYIEKRLVIVELTHYLMVSLGRRSVISPGWFVSTFSKSTKELLLSQLSLKYRKTSDFNFRAWNLSVIPTKYAHYTLQAQWLCYTSFPFLF